MDFKQSTITQITQSAIKSQLILLYFLKKSEEEVAVDVRKAVKNIVQWLEMTLFPKNNPYQMKLHRFIAAE